MIPLSCLLAQCGSAPNGGATAQHSGASFNDRFQAAEEHSFDQRFQSAEVFSPRQPVEPSRKRVASFEPAPPKAERAQPKVAALSPAMSYQRPQTAQELTTLVSLQSSAFPYLGKNPRTDEPFLNISNGERRGHRANGRVYWQDETYSDNRVLVHIPKQFDPQKPGVIVVFFHGNGATLERDVRDRQLVPQQITDSGANAVLLAPQLAVDAADSSAGKFWQPGGLKRFLAESAEHLARLTGDPNAAKAFANMPVVIVAYSGGFVPAAYSLAVGGLDGRIKGVFLLDALYGELDKFADWIASNRSAFFVSSYTRYTKRRDDELMRMLRDKGIRVAEDMDEPLRPSSVVFVQTPNGVTHRDYVTHAWTENPVKDVLAKMAAMPTPTRVASNAVSR
ncbi:MAG: alpha/beta hydrolase [Rhodopseudomonas sp.]|nr:alpha/beta hydrolase [Rhodopseudomonas sp.]